MGLFIILLAFSCLSLSFIFHSIQAQNEYSLVCDMFDLPQPQGPQDFLDAHNVARAQVGVGPMTWDANVTSFAQNYANQRIGDCNLVHSTNSPYGENIAAGSGDFTGRNAVNLWVGERNFYVYNTNACAQGRVCGHYTQVVWRNSIRLGCARVRCNNGWWFITCNYDPPGNFVGQRPY